MISLHLLIVCFSFFSYGLQARVDQVFHLRRFSYALLTFGCVLKLSASCYEPSGLDLETYACFSLVWARWSLGSTEGFILTLKRADLSSTSCCVLIDGAFRVFSRAYRTSFCSVRCQSSPLMICYNVAQPCPRFTEDLVLRLILEEVHLTDLMEERASNASSSLAMEDAQTFNSLAI